jgi:hypothetical protein
MSTMDWDDYAKPSVEGSLVLRLADVESIAAVMGAELSEPDIDGTRSMKISATRQRPMLDFLIKRLMATDVAVEMTHRGMEIKMDFKSFDEPKVTRS